MAKQKASVEMKRLNINIPIHIAEKVKEYADNLGINTTSAYIVLLNQALEQRNQFNQLAQFNNMYNEIGGFNGLKGLDEK